MKTFYYLGTIMFAYAAIAFLGIAIFVNPEDKTEYLPWIWLSVIGLFNRTVYLESEVDRGSRITDNRSVRKERENNAETETY